MCGGTSSLFLRFHTGRGLSPRVRGNPFYIQILRFAERSIPACAGEPITSTMQPLMRWVYPRVCGGTNTARAEDYEDQGLSPRVRGNRLAVLPAVLPIGSIPACAGEPPIGCGLRVLAVVYPRVCGGTLLQYHGQLPANGLSPRVRGNLIRRPSGCARCGSIPACAGEPSPASPVIAALRVYPRVCGGTCPPYSAAS